MQPCVFAPETTGRIGSVTQTLVKSDGADGWVEEEVPFNTLFNALCQLTSFQAVGASPVFQLGHTYDNNANRTGDTITTDGASTSFTSALSSNRQTDAAGITSRYNGWGQRFLRENDLEQSVFSYGLEGFTLLSQTTRRLAASQQSTTEHVWLPTASGPMPVAAVIDGVHYAVHADHLNAPRRQSDSTRQTRWQWLYSGFGEIAPQSTPAPGQAPPSFALRYPVQIDDGNQLFYDWHRFYEPQVGRYTKADPIGLDGGWNRFGYVAGNPITKVDPSGLAWWLVLPVLIAGYEALDFYMNLRDFRDCGAACPTSCEDGTNKKNASCKSMCAIKHWGTPNGPGPWNPLSK